MYIYILKFNDIIKNLQEQPQLPSLSKSGDPISRNLVALHSSRIKAQPWASGPCWGWIFRKSIRNQIFRKRIRNQIRKLLSPSG